MSRLAVAVLVTALVNVVVVVELVRRRRMRERFALLWLAVGAGGIVLALARPLVDRLAEAAGVALGTSLLFSAAILFLLLVCVLLSIHVTQLEDKVEALAEEITLLRGVQPPAPDDEPPS